jgi:hypothetical protein
MNHLKRTLFSLIMVAGFGLAANAQSCPTVYPISVFPTPLGMYGACEYHTSLFSCTFVSQPGQTYSIALSNPSLGTINVVNDYTPTTLRRVWFEVTWNPSSVPYPAATLFVTFTVNNGSCGTTVQQIYRVYKSGAGRC